MTYRSFGWSSRDFRHVFLHCEGTPDIDCDNSLPDYIGSCRFVIRGVSICITVVGLIVPSPCFQMIATIISASFLHRPPLCYRLLLMTAFVMHDRRTYVISALPYSHVFPSLSLRPALKPMLHFSPQRCTLVGADSGSEGPRGALQKCVSSDLQRR